MKKMAIKKISLLVFFLSAGFNVLSQQKGLDTLIVKFDRYRKNTIQEKIYVHTDRNFYLTGETLWFSIYNVDGTLHNLLDMSKVAYIEILDKKNNSVMHAKVDLNDGLGNGALFIPVSVNSGNYTLRAYTQWMKNFSPEFFFHKNITIVNSFIKVEPARRVASAQPTVQFFPEGGNLVTGLKSKVAFKVTSASGEGIDCKGAILNQHNDTITSFQTLKSGIGTFYYTPLENEASIVIIDKNNHTSRHKLPAVYEKGYVMSVTDSAAQQVQVLVKSTTTESRYLYLFAHARQMVVCAAVQPGFQSVGSSRVDLQACKLEYSIVSPK